jgi:hypothetical protein
MGTNGRCKFFVSISSHPCRSRDFESANQGFSEIGTARHETEMNRASVTIDRGGLYTVKPEITHTLGGHQFLWVITGYGFSQV